MLHVIIFLQPIELPRIESKQFIANLFASVIIIYIVIVNTLYTTPTIHTSHTLGSVMVVSKWLEISILSNLIRKNE